ncbi:MULTISPECIES: hypothetical protein [unclassified Candidatus Tisiphia]|uniref:hypothetical protein n=1 Tax=unclassified Candidatus Tisiphia TaxID=2996318 RepID=UPI00312C8095
MLAKGNLLKALEEYQAALELCKDYSLALDGRDKVLAELAKITTTEAVTIAKNTTQAESSTPTTPQDQTPPSAKEWTVKNIVDTAVSSGVAILTVLAAGAFLYKKGSDIYEACLEYLSKSDPKLKDCNGHGLLESDQFIPSNDNGDAKVIQDLSVSLTGAEDLVTSEV